MMRAKKLLSVFLVLLLVVMSIPLVGCSTEKAASANAGKTAKKKPYNIAVIVKGTDSDFWQYMILGAKAAAKQYPSDVKVTIYGPPSESDIDKQVSILENVVSNNPDAIVIASTSSDATVPALKDATSKGIPVITCDNQVSDESVYKSFLRTDASKAGVSAAEQMVAAWKKAGIDPSNKKVTIISAMSGVKVVMTRDEGFTTRLKELVPTIKFLQTKYCDNDISKALANAEDYMAANKDLIGIFADNNHTGDGVGRAITEKNASSSIVAIAGDSDDEEVSCLKSGALKALIVQDPYGEGYKGVLEARDCIEGKSVPKVVDTGATVVTVDNMNDAKIAKLLDPRKS